MKKQKIETVASPQEDGVTLEEQLQRRQSAPMPTVQDQLMAMASPQPGADGTSKGFDVLVEVIGREQIAEALQILQDYKAGKANLENRIIENEQWYKLRHWECMRKSSTASEVEPASGWLFNCIANKHADCMDNYPAPNILPREEADRGAAQALTSIVPLVLQQNDFEEVYDRESDSMIKFGTGIYGVFWDESKLNGLGDISIREIDILNIFWEPGITDIQKSRNIFHVELRDNDLLEAEYPQLKGKLGSSVLNVSQYVYDDTVNTKKKSAVVDWYYKVSIGKKTVLHFCKFVGDTVLYASENDPGHRTRGWYDHGLYPFQFDPLFKVAGTPCGFGYIDVGKSSQEYIDRGNKSIMENMLANSRPRHFIRTDGGVNEEEYLDISKDLVHFSGGVPSDSILPIQGKPLPEIYVSVINNKIDELKETTGNRDISTGGSTSGVTAASAIAAMQEAGSKLSRDTNKARYRTFRKVIYMVVELIRQFYDLPRAFRILGTDGAAKFISFSNAEMVPQHQGVEMGVDLGYRTPLFDIEISAQKQSPYSKLSQNEMALQFYGAGFFNPQLADQALACLEMMDFDRKQFVQQRIAQNGGMYQQLLVMQQQMLQLAQLADRGNGTNMAEQMAAGINGGPAPARIAPSTDGSEAEETGSLGGKEGPREAASTKNARQRVAESTSPA